MIEIVVKRNPNKFERNCEFCKSELRLKNSDLRINTLNKNIVWVCPVCRRLNLEKYRTDLKKIFTYIDPKLKNVHTSHCCIEHGCKYRGKDCDVVNMTALQEYDCEDCNYEERY